jgi:hypothetical protein
VEALAVVADAFDGGDAHAGHGAQQAEARVDRPVELLAREHVSGGEHDGAGAAATLAAADLRALEPSHVAQIVD